MTIKIVISAAIVSTIITVIGSLITAKMARTTAKETAREAADQEIKKLERTWAREDVVSSDEEFAEMAKAIATDIHCPTVATQKDAVGKAAGIRAKEYGRLGETLDRLYSAIVEDENDMAEKMLTKAIDQKRLLTNRSTHEDSPEESQI